MNKEDQENLKKCEKHLSNIEASLIYICMIITFIMILM